jgi:flavodoxin
MNICISYFSKFGNGKICVDELSSALTDMGHSVTVINIPESNPTELPQADVYVFSSPTRAGQPTGKVNGFIKKGSYADGAGFGIMSTGMDLSTGALNKLSAAAEKRGLKKAAEGIRLKLGGLKGPLDEGFKDKIKAFADGIGSFSR